MADLGKLIDIALLKLFGENTISPLAKTVSSLAESLSSVIEKIGSVNTDNGDLQTQINNIPKYSNFIKSGSGAKSGLVPAPPTTAGTGKYLREDGTWQTPPDTDTWRGIQNNLTSTSTSDSLAAAQGKELKALIDEVKSLRATLNAYGLVKVTDSSAVTDSSGLALAATEKNASISGTLANQISQLNTDLLEKFYTIENKPGVNGSTSNSLILNHGFLQVGSTGGMNVVIDYHGNMEYYETGVLTDSVNPFNMFRPKKQIYNADDAVCGVYFLGTGGAGNPYSGPCTILAFTAHDNNYKQQIAIPWFGADAENNIKYRVYDLPLGGWLEWHTS